MNSMRNGRGSTLGMEASLAVELESAYRAGHLPHAGGWLDQDEYHVRLITIAGSARAKRMAIEKRKQEARQEMLKRRLRR